MLRFAKGVEIRFLTQKSLYMLFILEQLGRRMEYVPTVTGVQGDEKIYPKGGTHEKGDAVDIRSIDAPVGFEELLKLELGMGFGIMKHDVGYGEHFHLWWKG